MPDESTDFVCLTPCVLQETPPEDARKFNWVHKPFGVHTGSVWVRPPTPRSSSRSSTPLSSWLTQDCFVRDTDDVLV